jgi:ribose 5-phosphate isomerase A
MARREGPPGEDLHRPDARRDALAAAPVAEIRSGMTAVLGTGRTATRAIEALARRVSAEGMSLRCIAPSRASDQLGRRLGLRVRAMEGVERIDYLFDGADEVDASMRMIKGRSGAMTREKIVARAAANRVYLVQSAKLVERLGETAPLPTGVDLTQLDAVLDGTPGVVGHGLFLTEADVLLVEDLHGRVSRRSRRSP